MRVADVKLTWRKSPSQDLKSQKMILTIDGTETTSEFGPDVEEVMIVVKPAQTFTFQVVTTDSEGLEATSVSYTFTVGDLETPLPATDLAHVIVAIRDEPDPEPTP
jgi:hypothetical protein